MENNTIINKEEYKNKLWVSPTHNYEPTFAPTLCKSAPTSGAKSTEKQGNTMKVKVVGVREAAGTKKGYSGGFLDSSNVLDFHLVIVT